VVGGSTLLAGPKGNQVKIPEHVGEPLKVGNDYNSAGNADGSIDRSSRLRLPGCYPWKGVKPRYGRLLRNGTPVSGVFGRIQSLQKSRS